MAKCSVCNGARIVEDFGNFLTPAFSTCEHCSGSGNEPQPKLDILIAVPPMPSQEAMREIIAMAREDEKQTLKHDFEIIWPFINRKNGWESSAIKEEAAIRLMKALGIDFF